MENPLHWVMPTKVTAKVTAKVQWEAKSLDVDPRNYSLAKTYSAEQCIELRQFINNAIGREIRRHIVRSGQ